MSWVLLMILLIIATLQKLSSGVYWSLLFSQLLDLVKQVHVSVTFKCTTPDTPLMSVIPTAPNVNGSAPSFLFPHHLLTSKRVKHTPTC